MITSKNDQIRYFMKGFNLRIQMVTLSMVAFGMSFQDIVEFYKKAKSLVK